MELLSNLESVRHQLTAILTTIRQLEKSEFPYSDPRIGLAAIRKQFDLAQDALALVDSSTDQATADSICKTTYDLISDSLEILGLLLRSTNVRNSFECHGPLLRLAKSVLGPDTHLVVSSEWSFSPYTLIGYMQLPGFVLIGLPATESENPLLLPLAGHELGHSMWQQKSIEAQIRPGVYLSVLQDIEQHWSDYIDVFPGIEKEDLESDMFARQTWLPSLMWAMRQCEEVFCDAVGIKIFGPAYLQAFAYLLAPGRGGSRSSCYPNIKERGSLLNEIAIRLGLPNNPLYSARFSSDVEPTQTTDKRISLLLRIADEARRKVFDDVIAAAFVSVDKSGYPGWNDGVVEMCIERFRLTVPCENSVTLANIVIAAWRAMIQSPFFVNDAFERDKKAIISELALKSIEVLEIETRIKVES